MIISISLCFFVTDYYTPTTVSKCDQPSAPNNHFQHDNINFHLPNYATNDGDPDNTTSLPILNPPTDILIEKTQTFIPIGVKTMLLHTMAKIL